MPSVSKKQHNFMAAVANNPAFAKKAGVPQSVGKDFSNADKGRKFSKGGETMANTSRMNRLEELGRVDAEKASSPMGKKNLMAEKKRIVGEMKYAKGGPVKHEDVKMDKAMMQKAVNKHEGRLHKGEPMTKLAKGGTFRASANGIATKGKTKATMVKMAYGGKACK